MGAGPGATLQVKVKRVYVSETPTNSKRAMKAFMGPNAYAHNGYVNLEVLGWAYKKLPSKQTRTPCVVLKPCTGGEGREWHGGDWFVSMKAGSITTDAPAHQRWRRDPQDASTQEDTAADGQGAESNATSNATVEPPQPASHNVGEEIDGVRGVSSVQDVVERTDDDNLPVVENDPTGHETIHLCHSHLSPASTPTQDRSRTPRSDWDLRGWTCAPATRSRTS